MLCTNRYAPRYNRMQSADKCGDRSKYQSLKSVSKNQKEPQHARRLFRRLLHVIRPSQLKAVRSGASRSNRKTFPGHYYRLNPIASAGRVALLSTSCTHRLKCNTRHRSPKTSQDIALLECPQTISWHFTIRFRVRSQPHGTTQRTALSPSACIRPQQVLAGCRLSYAQL